MEETKALLSRHQAQDLNSQIAELLKAELSLTEKYFRVRQILESLFKNLTAQINITFTGLYARMQYTLETHQVPQTLTEQLHLLRLTTNKVIHEEDYVCSLSEFTGGIKALADTIAHFAETPIPPEISRFLEQAPTSGFSIKTAVHDATITSLVGVVQRWQRSDVNGSSQFLEITCQTAEGSEIVVTLWEKRTDANAGRCWTVLDKTLWKYCNIVFYNLSPVKGKANCFQSTPLTLVVLEPDFLMDVSSIAECFQNKTYYPELFIINKFIVEPVTPQIIKGKLVNFIFDELVFNPARPVRQLFDEYLTANPLITYVLGHDTLTEIFGSIETEHLPQIRAQADEFQKLPYQLEPSFISLQYGLHGRLDLISLPGNGNDKYTILELKSGSVPAYDTWKSHQMQVIGYNLIVREVYGDAQVAHSSIFYSKATDKPRRYVTNHVTAEQDFLMCRNRIVGILQKLATEPVVFVSWLKNNCQDYQPYFLKEKIASVKKALSELMDYETSWLLGRLEYMFREIWSVKTGAFCKAETSTYGFSALWNASLAEKKNQFRIIDGLWIDAMDNDLITLLRQENDAVSNLREGDIVVMYKQNLPPNKQTLIRATIVQADEHLLKIRTRSKITSNGIIDPFALWAVEPDIMESSLYGGLSSLFGFITAPMEKRAKLLGIMKPETEPYLSPLVFSWRPDIQESLLHCIEAKDYYLVQGPPGTGKTSCLLMQYVQYLMAETKKKITLLSFTNRAVDEICYHLDKQQLAYFRLGSYEGAGGQSKQQSAPSLYQIPAHNADFAHIRIYVSTLHTFLANAPDLLSKVTIDELLVDEASQILEHQIIGLMARIDKTILIGDQNQLPPISVQQNPEGSHSIFEFLLGVADKYGYLSGFSMLTQHFRMHRDIADLVGSVYHDKLSVGSDRQQKDHPWIETADGFLSSLLAKRLVWLEASPTGQSKIDLMQAEWIGNFIGILYEDMPDKQFCSGIGIITPFRAQVQCIRSLLNPLFRDITIDTVERFQGSERDCIIISLPVKYAYELKLIQSMSADDTVDRKLNVALSRAREQLIILGSSKILCQSTPYRHVYHYICQHGKVISL